jgi:hypothetical protein
VSSIYKTRNHLYLSLLAPLAAFALHDDALAAGQARFFCILIGVANGTTCMLILTATTTSKQERTPK